MQYFFIFTFLFLITDALENQIIDKEKSIHSDDPKVRVLEFNILFANGIPSDISSKQVASLFTQVLMKDIYFGRYGKIIKSILNAPYPFKKGVGYQAYVTYQNEIDASLAITALDGLYLGDHSLKASYGTTKYCLHFLKRKNCPNKDCIYLHQLRKNHEVLSGDNRNLFREQNERALDTVLNNMEKIVQKILDSKIEHIQSGFPSLTETIDFLIDNQYLSLNEYNTIVDQVIKKRKKLTNNQKCLQKIDQISVKLNKQKQDHNLIQQPIKLIKSCSFSTVASPNKIGAASTEFDEEQKGVLEIDNEQNINIKQRFFSGLNFEDRTVRSQNQSNISYQRIQDFEQSIESIILKKIQKQIMKKKSIKSRFNFVKFNLIETQTVDEIKKVKNIIQRFLIKYQ